MDMVVCEPEWSSSRQCAGPASRLAQKRADMGMAAKWDFRCYGAVSGQQDV